MHTYLTLELNRPAPRAVRMRSYTSLPSLLSFSLGIANNNTTPLRNPHRQCLQ